MNIALCKSLFLFVIIPVLTIPSYAYGGQVSVVASDADRCRLVVSVEASALLPHLESDSLNSYYDNVLIGIPYGADIRLTDAKGRGRSVAASQLAGGERMSGVSRPLIELSEPFTVRGRQLVAARINPVTTAFAYDEIEFEVSFSGGRTSGSAPRDPWFAKVFSSVVNLDRFLSWPAPASLAKQTQVSGPFADGGDWYKIAVNRSGLCRITGAMLQSAGLMLPATADEISVFTGYNGPLEWDEAEPPTSMRQVAALVRDGGDGLLDADDEILLYVDGPDRWVYESGVAPRFTNNQYDSKNVYWVTMNSGTGLRMSSEDVNPERQADTTITTFQRRVRMEQDNLLRKFYSGKVLDYYNWYWTGESPLEFFVSTPGRVEGTTASIVAQGRTFDPDFNNPAIGYMNLTVNGVEADEISLNQFNCRFTTTGLVNGNNEFRLDMWGNNEIGPYLDYLEMAYESYLTTSSPSLDVPLGGFDGTAYFEVTDNFAGELIALRLDDPTAPAVLTAYDRSAGRIALAPSMSVQGPNRFYFASASAAFSPVSITRESPADLYAATPQTDLIIVSSDQLLPALNDYISSREEAGTTVRSVTVDDIMDNFGFGVYDPTAIRNYLKYAFENYPSPAPHAVLLVGDGNYDYLNHLGTGVTNVVPPYLRPTDETASDDNYVYFGRYGVLDSDTSFITPDRGFDMMIARWPVRTASEIAIITDKSRRYALPSTFGSWRSQVTLVADDERGTFDNETFHVIQAEELEEGHIPNRLQTDKIYLWEYPLINRRKPAVNDAIVRNINRGTLLIDYIGHGNPDVWAGERVFTRDADLPRLNNVDRMPLVFAASCAIGFFDDPIREGMAEEFLAYPNGGAVAVISAARLVYATPNAAFNRVVFDQLLMNDSLSMAEALYLAKIERQYGSGSVPGPRPNDRAYGFFGDPFLRLGLPSLEVVFDAPPDSLMALERTTLSGRVVGADSMTYNVDGELFIDVYDSDREKTYRLINSQGDVTQVVDYETAGPAIFRGRATITAGEFSFDFITPLDVGYGGQGARVVTYARFDTIDGLGAVDSLSISTVVASTDDSTGPAIDYSIVGLDGFTDGDVIGEEATVELILSDPSGINLAGGLGHGITLVIDDEPQNLVDLTDRFAYDPDSFTQGSLQFSLEDVEPGRHAFKIKAWDNANNSATTAFVAEIQAKGRLAIIDLLNYPNPMQESTRFSYRLTDGVERLSLEIFTLSGRKIRSFERYPGVPGYYDDIIWYGDDHVGDRVATGVYIYKATAIPAGGGETVESFGKVVVVN